MPFNLPERVEAIARSVRICPDEAVPPCVRESTDFAQWLDELADDADLDWPEGTAAFCAGLPVNPALARN